MSDEFNGRRAYEVRLKISADDWDAVLQELQWLERHLHDHGPECTSVSGGWSHSHTVEVDHDPEWTGERYRAELERWSEARRSNPVSPPDPESAGGER